MNKFLPSKRFFYILLSIILAVLIVLGVKALADRSSSPKQMTDEQRKITIEQFKAVDTDGDGMKDWEEALWKTDPQKADSDADGTSDSEEIKTTRDPLKANTSKGGIAPNDKIAEEIIESNKKAEENFSKLTATEKFSQILFSQYLATKKVDQELSDADIYSIIQNTLAQASDTTGTVSLKQYSFFDLTISPTTSPEAMRKYGNDVATVIMNDLFNKRLAEQSYDFYGMTEIQNLMITMQDRANNDDNKKAFAALTPIIKEYKILVADLIKVNVPSNLATTHLDLVNAFELIHDNLAQIQQSASDIISLPTLLTYYPDNVTALWETINATGKTLKENKVIFGTDDIGNQLFGAIIVGN